MIKAAGRRKAAANRRQNGSLFRHNARGAHRNSLKNKEGGLATPLHMIRAFGGPAVIVVILGIAVLGLFVISLTSSLFGNRRQRF